MARGRRIRTPRRQWPRCADCGIRSGEYFETKALTPAGLCPPCQHFRDKYGPPLADIPGPARWTPDERVRLRELAAAGLGPAAIGRELGKPDKAVGRALERAATNADLGA